MIAGLYWLAMRTLYLLRHTVALASAPDGDRERRLSPAGELAAAALGDWLRLQAPLPELALCSPALRAQQTFALVAGRLPERPAADIEEAIYQGDEAGLFSRLRGIEDDIACCLVVGHNPLLHRFALALSGGGNDAALSRLMRELPPGGLVELTFDVDDWAAIGPRRGRLRAFVTPDELEP
ncbi:MAG TPA: histidine phosphatase family protein [Alphaproteobacteria bacterium]|nr:histidine phosphatase family protein [Alphaproteobacteria bacterium]